MTTREILEAIAKQAEGEYTEWDTGSISGERGSHSCHLRRMFEIRTPSRSVLDTLDLPGDSKAVIDTLELETERKRLEMILRIAKEGLASEEFTEVKVHLDRMNKIISFCLANKLPKEHHFFGTAKQIHQLMDWILQLGSSVWQTKINDVGDIDLHYFMYGGFAFYYHDVDKMPTNPAK